MSLGKAKLQEEISKRSGYVRVPQELFTVLSGKPSHLVVWAYLFNQSEGWHPSYPQIVDGTGLSRETIKRCMNDLVEMGLLLKTTPIAGWKNSYEFTEISTWKIPEGGTFKMKEGGLKMSLPRLKMSSFPEDPVKEDMEDNFKSNSPDKGFSSLKYRVPLPDKEEERTCAPTTSGNHSEAPRSTPDAVTHTNTRATPSIDEIRLDWESRNSIASGQPNLTTRLAALQELVSTLKEHGYKLEDVNTKRFQAQVLEHFFKRIKNKKSKAITERATNEEWQAALGIMVEGTIKVTQPSKPTYRAMVDLGSSEGESLSHDDFMMYLEGDENE